MYFSLFFLPLLMSYNGDDSMDWRSSHLRMNTFGNSRASSVIELEIFDLVTTLYQMFSWLPCNRQNEKKRRMRIFT